MTIEEAKTAFQDACLGTDARKRSRLVSGLRAEGFRFAELNRLAKAAIPKLTHIEFDALMLECDEADADAEDGAP